MYYYLFIAAFVAATGNGITPHPVAVSVTVGGPFADNNACLDAIRAFNSHVPQTALTPDVLWCQPGASHVPVPPLPVADCNPNEHHPVIDGVLRTDLCYPN